MSPSHFLLDLHSSPKATEDQRDLKPWPTLLTLHFSNKEIMFVWRLFLGKVSVKATYSLKLRRCECFWAQFLPLLCFLTVFSVNNV